MVPKKKTLGRAICPVLLGFLEHFSSVVCQQVMEYCLSVLESVELKLYVSSRTP